MRQFFLQYSKLQDVNLNENVLCNRGIVKRYSYFIGQFLKLVKKFVAGPTVKYKSCEKIRMKVSAYVIFGTVI